MRYLFFAFCLLSVYSTGICQGGASHHFQIGRSAYNFEDRPTKIGYTSIDGVAPYLSYTYSKKEIGIRISFEGLLFKYCKNTSCVPKVNEIFIRDFYQLQVNGVKHFKLFRAVGLSVLLEGVYRFKGSQSFIEKYVDHGTWNEALGVTEKLKGIGGGIGMELSYVFFKRFTISMKGEYLRLNNKPQNQIGLTASIGYRIIKKEKKE